MSGGHQESLSLECLGSTVNLSHRILWLGQVSPSLECLMTPRILYHCNAWSQSNISIIRMFGFGQESLPLEFLGSARCLCPYKAWGHTRVLIIGMPVEGQEPIIRIPGVGQDSLSLECREFARSLFHYNTSVQPGVCNYRIQEVTQLSLSSWPRVSQ